MRLAACFTAWLAVGGGFAPAAPPTPPLDPLQQSVVDSLAFPVRTTPREWLDAAIRAADVDALDVALGYFGRLVEPLEAAGPDRLQALADLGDAFDPADIGRLDAKLRPQEPAVGKVLAAIREAAALRRRDPARLAAAANALASASAAERRTAAARLAAARENALPALVDVLQSDAAEEPAKALARGLLRDLGAAARQPLLEWLAADDVARWPGIIAALAASGVDDIETFLLAPALVVDTPPAARAAAIEALQARAAARGDDPSLPVPPSADDAIARLAARLDRVLGPAGLPEVAAAGRPRPGSDAPGPRPDGARPAGSRRHSTGHARPARGHAGLRRQSDHGPRSPRAGETACGGQHSRRFLHPRRRRRARPGRDPRDVGRGGGRRAGHRAAGR
jgi:hypothetical protein